MAVLRIQFQSIPVHDQDRALAFYTERLGIDIVTDVPFEGDWRWIFLGIPGAETRLQFAKPEDIQVNDKPALCLACDDVDREVEALRPVLEQTSPTNPRTRPGHRVCGGPRFATAKKKIVFIESFEKSEA